MTHAHRHGDHEHHHDHPGAGAAHSHGWHSPAATCTGDAVFGEEEGVREPSRDYIRAQLLGAGAVIVPYVPGMLHDEAAALGRPVDVSRSEWDYWELVRQLWRGGQTFVLVEQDMAPSRAQVDNLFWCPERWCVHDYRVQQGTGADIAPWVGMGVVKWSVELMAQEPDLVENISQTTWSRLDETLGRALLAHGYAPHIHEPPVEHLHDYHR